MLKKFPSDKINGTKNVIFFHTFTFNLRFLFELKHKVHLSKTVCEIFHFRSRFVFIKVCIFVQQNAWTLLTLMLITAFELFRPEGHREPHNEVGSLSLAEHLVGV